MFSGSVFQTEEGDPRCIIFVLCLRLYRNKEESTRQEDGRRSVAGGVADDGSLFPAGPTGRGARELEGPAAE